MLCLKPLMGQHLNTVAKIKVNPGSVILSGEMMLRYLGWNEAADLIIKAMDKTIRNQTVTYDFARLMDDVDPIKCSEFGDQLIKNMN